MVGVVTHDFFDDLSDEEVRRGMGVEQRDRMLQTFVRNHYTAHLQEILLTLQNEYTDWEESVQHSSTVREQVSNISKLLPRCNNLLFHLYCSLGFYFEMHMQRVI